MCTPKIVTQRSQDATGSDRSPPTNQTALRDFLERARCPASSCDCHKTARTGKGLTHCPIHDDPKPSLSVTPHRGTVFWNCFAGCPHEDLTAALRTAGVLGGGEDMSPRKGSNPRANACTLEDYVREKHLSLAYLRSRGLSVISYGGAPAVKIPFFGEDGNEFTAQFRTPSGKRFKAKAPTGLYGLELLHGYRHSSTSIVLCEGASDQQTLDLNGFPALGLPGAGNWKDARDAASVEPFEVIYVIVEPDSGGATVMRWLAQSSIRTRARILRMKEFKDPSAMFLADPDGFAANFTELLQTAEPYIDIPAAERDEEAMNAAELAGALLDDTDLVTLAGRVIAERGYAGNTLPAQLAFVAITSRFLSRPMNLAFIGPSAAGKNEAIRAGAALHPEEAVVWISAGSPRAVVYDDDDYAFKMVVFEEVDSIPDEGPAAAAVRAIAEKGEMTYAVVERDERTGKHLTRHIVKRGPTGLITTSTKPLKQQLGTRMLEVSITDSEAQTRDVMRIHARRAAGDLVSGPDAEPWIAVMRWLAVAGERRIVVPFAVALIDLLPAHLVRLRRDSAQLLTCIGAIAFMHQRHRPRSDAGEVVASIEDYGMARDLLSPVFDAISAEGVTDAVRETVEALGADEETTQAELTRRLGMAKSTVHTRVARALAEGWLVKQ